MELGLGCREYWLQASTRFGVFMVLNPKEAVSSIQLVDITNYF